MRTPLQSGLIVGVGAGLVIAVVNLLAGGAEVNGLLLLLVVLLSGGAGALAAALARPVPGATIPAAGSPTPTLRGQQVRAASLAGALAGVGFVGAGLVRLAAALGAADISTSLNSIAASAGVTPDTLRGLIGCVACGVFLIFPLLFAGLGALGGWLWTALRPARL